MLYVILCVASLTLPSQAAPADTPCPAGHFCPPGFEKPIPCPKGTYCAIGSTFPAVCPSGTYNGQEGESISHKPVACEVLILKISLFYWFTNPSCRRRKKPPALNLLRFPSWLIITEKWLRKKGNKTLKKFLRNPSPLILKYPETYYCWNIGNILLLQELDDWQIALHVHLATSVQQDLSDQWIINEWIWKIMKNYHDTDNPLFFPLIVT